MTLRDRINPHIRELEPYQPGKPLEELERELGLQDSVKLASNEHPVGASPRVIEAIRACASEVVHRYPDGASFALRRQLSDRLGIDPDQLEKLFEPFSRGEDAHHTSGAGLGLAIAREQANLLNAELIVDNRDGGGARFIVEIPVTNDGDDL